MIHPIDKFCGCLLPSTPRTDAARQRARSTPTLIDELQRCSEELERELAAKEEQVRKLEQKLFETREKLADALGWPR